MSNTSIIVSNGERTIEAPSQPRCTMGRLVLLSEIKKNIGKTYFTLGACEIH